MKIDFTNVELKVSAFGILFALSVIAAILSMPGCSSGIESKNQNILAGYSGDKSFSFRDEGSNWRVDFDDDEISALYKDGARVPDNEIDQHKEMIYDKLNGLKSDFKEFDSNVYKFHFDLDKFDEEMKKFKNDFDKEKFMHFKLEFDEDEFEKNMEVLGERLKDLKDKKIELCFDSEEFKENMKELQEKLKDLPIPPNTPGIDLDIYLDIDDFKDGMKKFGESFKHFDFKFDSSEFDLGELRNNMKDLKKNLKGLKIEIHGLKGEMQKLNSFLEELKSELVQDGYINSAKDKYGLEMNNDYTKIDNVQVKTEHHKKYKELYKRHFEKEIDGMIKINSD